MNKFIYSLLILISLSIVNCTGEGDKEHQNRDNIDDTAAREVVETRYGIPTEGYRLQEDRVRSGETMGNILGSFGRTALDVDLLDRAAQGIFSLKDMRAGNLYTAFITTDSLGEDRLDYIAYERNLTEYVLFTMLGDSMAVTKGEKPTITTRNKRSSTINSSLWGSIMEQELPFVLASELEGIYQWSVDFFGIQKGDSFTVIYDEIFVEDSISVGIGQIWGAKFVHSGKEYYAVPYNQNGNIEFWDEEGGSLKKQMLKAPLQYSRISSRFSNARLHPIYKVYRPHHGVDYAAPSGTPVHSVADGVVTFCGWGGGGGNTIKIKHPNDIATGYLHLSRFASGIKLGTHVSQGELIGYVGSTGDSTGPHLDYRVWRHGVAIDPLTIPQEPSEPISYENTASFNTVKRSIIDEINGDIPDAQKIKSVDMLLPGSATSFNIQSNYFANEEREYAR